MYTSIQEQRFFKNKGSTTVALLSHCCSIKISINSSNLSLLSHCYFLCYSSAEQKHVSKNSSILLAGQRKQYGCVLHLFFLYTAIAMETLQSVFIQNPDFSRMISYFVVISVQYCHQNLLQTCSSYSSYVTYLMVSKLCCVYRHSRQRLKW